MNTSYEPPEIVGIVIGLALFSVLILWALSGSNSEPSNAPGDVDCDPRTGCW